MTTVKIPILRLGDTSKVSVVRVHTKDGSATSGDDYNPLSEGNNPHFNPCRVLAVYSFNCILRNLSLSQTLSSGRVRRNTGWRSTSCMMARGR